MLSTPQLRVPVDLVSCSRQRCLYVADGGRNALQRLCPGGDSTLWPLGDKPSSLSISRPVSSAPHAPHAAGNILVTFGLSRVLREYSADGVMLRQINLAVDNGKNI